MTETKGPENIESTETQAPPEAPPEGEAAIRAQVEDVRGLLELDYSNVEGSPEKYRVRKLKGKDLKMLRSIVLDALDEMKEVQEGVAAVQAENAPAYEQARIFSEENLQRRKSGESLLPLPDMHLKPEPSAGMEIARAALSGVADKLLFDDDSWLASLLEESKSTDDLDHDWYLSVVEKVIERDDLPNLLARHLRVYQVFSSALRTKSASATASRNGS